MNMKIFRSLVVHCAAKKKDFADGLNLEKKWTLNRTRIVPINLVSLSGIDIYVTRLLTDFFSRAVLNPRAPLFVACNARVHPWMRFTREIQ